MYNLEELKKLSKEDIEEIKCYDIDEYPTHIQKWLEYGDTQMDDTVYELVREIDNQRFCFGDWESDLESVMRGDCYDDSRLCQYIRKMEALVEHLKTKNNL